MFNWKFEGSLDKKQWVLLDQRAHIFENEKDNFKFENERNALLASGATSTYEIEKSITDKYPQGFRYFKIMQTSLNSSGHHNMALSGLELYGFPLGDYWEPEI
jgi:hypothetical protein